MLTYNIQPPARRWANHAQQVRYVVYARTGRVVYSHRATPPGLQSVAYLHALQQMFGD